MPVALNKDNYPKLYEMLAAVAADSGVPVAESYNIPTRGDHADGVWYTEEQLKALNETALSLSAAELELMTAGSFDDLQSITQRGKQFSDLDGFLNDSFLNFFT